MNNFTNFASRKVWLKRTISAIEFVASIAVLLVLYLHISVLPVRATIVVDDHFNNDSLDPAWSIICINADGWAYTESGTTLNVTDITPTVINPDSGGTLAEVVLSRNFSPLTDFHADFDFSWDSANSIQAMQNVYIRLYDADDNLISFAGYNDAWVAHRGGQSAGAGEGRYFSNNDTLSYNGSASVDIDRAGSNITVSWNGVDLISGEDDNPLCGIDVHFMYYAYSGSGGPSFFGTESIDLVKIEGTPVPLPCTMLLFGSGFAGVIGLRKKKLFKKV